MQPVPKAFSLRVGKAKLAMMFGNQVLTRDTADDLVLLLPYGNKSTNHAVAKLHLVEQPDCICALSVESACKLSNLQFGDQSFIHSKHT